MARILLIEDDDSWVKLYTKYFAMAGHDTQHIPSIDSAIIDLRNRGKYDLIIFDLYLIREPGHDPLFWVNAFIEGLLEKNIIPPPIILVTGLELNRRQIIAVFTSYRKYIYGLFQKSDFDRTTFMECIRNVLNDSREANKNPKSLLKLFFVTLILLIIVLAIYSILLWGIGSITDQYTQQTYLRYLSIDCR
jgi:DNA-binding response OmpR family regulator